MFGGARRAAGLGRHSAALLLVCAVRVDKGLMEGTRATDAQIGRGLVGTSRASVGLTSGSRRRNSSIPPQPSRLASVTMSVVSLSSCACFRTSRSAKRAKSSANSGGQPLCMQRHTAMMTPRPAVSPGSSTTDLGGKDFHAGARGPFGHHGRQVRAARILGLVRGGDGWGKDGIGRLETHVEVGACGTDHTRLLGDRRADRSMHARRGGRRRQRTKSTSAFRASHHPDAEAQCANRPPHQ